MSDRLNFIKCRDITCPFIQFYELKLNRINVYSAYARIFSNYWPIRSIWRTYKGLGWAFYQSHKTISESNTERINMAEKNIVLVKISTMSWQVSQTVVQVKKFEVNNIFHIFPMVNSTENSFNIWLKSILCRQTLRHEQRLAWAMRIIGEFRGLKIHESAIITNNMINPPMFGRPTCTCTFGCSCISEILDWKSPAFF